MGELGQGLGGAAENGCRIAPAAGHRRRRPRCRRGRRALERPRGTVRVADRHRCVSRERGEQRARRLGRARVGQRLVKGVSPAGIVEGLDPQRHDDALIPEPQSAFGEYYTRCRRRKRTSGVRLRSPALAGQLGRMAGTARGPIRPQSIRPRRKAVAKSMPQRANTVATHQVVNTATSAPRTHRSDNVHRPRPCSRRRSPPPRRRTADAAATATIGR